MDTILRVIDVIKRNGAKLKLRDWVTIFGHTEVRSVEEIRENPAAETMYWIQLGRDFATRVWAKESELEAAHPREGHTLILPDGTSRVRIENVSEGVVDISPERLVAPIPIEDLAPVPGEKDVWQLANLSSTTPFWS